jgi:hypothetical protein
MDFVKNLLIEEESGIIKIDVIKGCVSMEILMIIGILVLKHNQSLYKYEERNLININISSNAANDGIPDQGPIPNAKIARKVAESIFNNEFNGCAYDYKPFYVLYDEKGKLWLVKGRTHKNVQGGAPYLYIQKDDGKVLAVWFKY